ncbi:unnamed protein product [Somion occarium]|uniref:Cytochrome b5 heme-binding domain-containing protein n=1 Tax=Somion occarium TaxID=3059160 RepID=A0ABP1ECA3_9APHY
MLFDLHSHVLLLDVFTFTCNRDLFGYLRSWTSSVPSLGLTSSLPGAQPAPNIIEVPATEEDDEDDAATLRGDDEDVHIDDLPPAFPSLNGAQRAGSSKETTSSTIPRILTDSELMPPPPLPGLASRRPGTSSVSSASSSFLLVPSGTSSLTVPLSTLKPPNKKATKKVALAPGHGPLDWANLKKSGKDLRGVDTLSRIPMSVLKQHNKRDDAWSAFNGKVYNITPYLPYHPGGEKELMRVAGRDGSKLFALTHGWVNIDYMLDECLVGFLVPDS